MPLNPALSKILRACAQEINIKELQDNHSQWVSKMESMLSRQAQDHRALLLECYGLPADPPYRDFYQQEWGSYAVVPIDQYRQLREAGQLPDNVLLFREPAALFFRPPVKTPALSISAVQTVFSVAPSSVGPADEDNKYIAVPKKAIRAAKQQLRAAREALNALDPFVRSAETKIKTHLDSFTTPPRNGFKSASEPPSPKSTAEHTCRKCGDSSFRSRNALFDHIYSNTCEKSSNLQSSIITPNDTPVSSVKLSDSKIAPALKTSSTWLRPRLASSTTMASPAPPRASDSHGLFTPVKNRPVSALPNRGNESPIEWEFKKSLPVTPAPSSSSQAATPNGSHGNKLDGFKRPSTPSSPCSCRTCSKSFASRNLLFAHLRDHSHCRPVKSSPGKKTMLSTSSGKSFLIQNTSWRSGKLIQMDSGVLGDIMSKLAAVASAA